MLIKVDNPPMLQRLRNPAIFLGIGLLLNLSIAWSVALYSTHQLRTDGWQATLKLGRTAAVPNEAWLFWRLDKPGLTAFSFTPPAYPTLSSRKYDENGYDFRPDLIEGWTRIDRYQRPLLEPIHGIYVEATGWPLRSMTASESRTKATIDVDSGLVIHQAGVRRTFPLRPLWFGFLGNTLLFGLPLWGFVTLMRYTKYRLDKGRTIPVTYSFAQARQKMQFFVEDMPDKNKAA